MNAEQQKLVAQLWQERPKLYVHGAGTGCVDLTGQDGKEEAWPLSPDVLNWMAEVVAPGAVTLETGCGYSTMLFAILGARHTAIAPDYQQHGRITGWCERHGVSCGNLRLIDACSQDVLPGLALDPLDLVLIDGSHAFPAPFIDWYYTAEKLKPGGILIVDDCHLVTGKILADFLEAENGRWELVRRFGKTSVFRKIAANPVVAGFEWIDQPYCAKRLGAPPPQGLRARLRRMLQPLGRLNSQHYLAYRLGLARPRTETTAAERACLHRHAAGRKRLAEIGVFQGVNTKAFRQAMASDGVILAVDPFPRSFFGIRGFGWARRIAHREVGLVPNGRVVWLECRGQDAPVAAAARPFLPVDFLFIDGDHGYEGLRGDWEAWKDHIAPGGIVALHDSRNRRGRGAERFTHEVIRQDPDFVLLEEVDSLTVLRRRGPEES